MVDESNDNSPSPKKIANGKKLAIEKKRKYQKKQDLKRKIEHREEKQNLWIQTNSHFVTNLENLEGFCLNNKIQSQCKKIRLDKGFASSSRQQEASIETKIPKEHNRIENTVKINNFLGPYVNLKEGSNLKGKTSNNQQLFIAEGTEVVRLLVNQCLTEKRYKVKLLSILVKPCALFDEPVKLIEDIDRVKSKSLLENKMMNQNEKEVISPPFQVIIGSEDTLSTIAGFHICRGAMACGIVPKKYNESWLWKEFFIEHNNIQSKNTTTPKKENSMKNRVPLRILALDQISNTSNLGSMIRSSAAFGINIILLSKDSCDAWYRQSVRVSMGHVFSIPIVRVRNLAETIQCMQSSYAIKAYASVVVPDKIPVSCSSELRLEKDHSSSNLNICTLEDLPKGSVSHQWCCVMGNEANGLSNEVIEACHKKITIGTSEGVDSLSVQVAAGILLHGLHEREHKCEKENGNP